MTGVSGLLVITNADAGTADEEALRAALDVLRPVTEVEVAATASPDDLDSALVGLGDRRIVVAGGDGSIHAVVASLHRRGDLEGREIGLVPLGTGNDFARGLGLPLEPDQAAHVALTGHAHPVDLIVDQDGSVTVNTVHVGAGAEAGERGAKWKSALGKVGVGRVNLGKVGYPIGALQTAFNPPGIRVRVEVDGELVTDVDTEVLMVALGNGPSVGGGTELTPDADPHDGLVDVLVAKPAGLGDRVALGLRLPFGAHKEHRTVQALRGRSVTISGSPFRCNSDGEIDGPVRRRSWRVLPAAYSMVLPVAVESEAGGPDN